MPGAEAPNPRIANQPDGSPAEPPPGRPRQGSHRPDSPSRDASSRDLPSRDAPSDDPRELWPRDFGRDGVSGLVNSERAMRARDVSRPRVEDDVAAYDVLAELLARVEGRRSTGPRSSARPQPADGS